MEKIKKFENFVVMKNDNFVKDVEILFLNTTDKEGRFYPTDCVDLNKLNSQILPGYIGNDRKEQSHECFNFNIRQDVLYCEIKILNNKFGRLLKTYVEQYTKDFVFRAFGSTSTFKMHNKDRVAVFNISEVNLIAKKDDKMVGKMKYYDHPDQD